MALFWPGCAHGRQYTQCAHFFTIAVLVGVHHVSGTLYAPLRIVSAEMSDRYDRLLTADAVLTLTICSQDVDVPSMGRAVDGASATLPQSCSIIIGSLRWTVSVVTRRRGRATIRFGLDDEYVSEFTRPFGEW